VIIGQKTNTRSRNTGTNSDGFTASRCGDSGKRLAAGEILPPFCVSGGALARVRDRGGETDRMRLGTRSAGQVWAISAVSLVIQWVSAQIQVYHRTNQEAAEAVHD